MFNKAAAAAPTSEVLSPLGKEPSEPLIPLSVLALDLPRPGEGWASYLHERNIPVGEDDLGRPAIARVDARQLLAQKRKAESERAQHLAAADRQAIQTDQAFRA